MVKNSFVGGIVALVVSLAVMLFGGNGQQLPSLGGLVHNTQERFSSIVADNLSGGLLTVASGSRHFTAPEICENSVITLDGDSYASEQAQVLPSAANLIKGCLPNKGDYRDVFWLNLSVDENPTIAAGTTIDVLIASGSAGTTVEIPTNKGVWTRFIRLEGSSVSVQFDEYKHQ